MSESAPDIGDAVVPSEALSVGTAKVDDRRTHHLWVALTGGSLLFAAYVGLRMPNLWSVTQYRPSLFDGFVRRSLVGTLLTPYFFVTGSNYAAAAAIAGAVLAVIVALIAWLGVTSRLNSQRFVVLAWVVAPTGAFLFHEVGYLEQIIYLLLFLAIWLVKRGNWIAPAALMAFACLTHELTLVSALPVFALVAYWTLDRRRAIVAVMMPALVGMIVVSLPTVRADVVNQLSTRLNAEGFPFRADALELFSRSQSESWELYSVRGTLGFLVPFAVVIVMIWVLVALAADVREPTANRPASWAMVLIMAGVSVAPAVLSLGGWDKERWAFLMVSNFAIVLYLWLGENAVEFVLMQGVAVALGFVLLTSLGIPYFDGASPRLLQVRYVKELAVSIGSGDFFQSPQR